MSLRIQPIPASAPSDVRAAIAVARRDTVTVTHVEDYEFQLQSIGRLWTHDDDKRIGRNTSTARAMLFWNRVLTIRGL